MPRQDHSAPIDITRLRMPLVLTVAFIAAIIGILGTIAGQWWAFSAHNGNHVIHLDEQSVTKGGGPAMQNDVASVRNDLKWQLLDAQNKTRRLLRHLKINCRKAGAGMACDVDVPDDE